MYEVLEPAGDGFALTLAGGGLVIDVLPAPRFGRAHAVLRPGARSNALRVRHSAGPEPAAQSRAHRWGY